MELEKEERAMNNFNNHSVVIVRNCEKECVCVSMYVCVCVCDRGRCSSLDKHRVHGLYVCGVVGAHLLDPEDILLPSERKGCG